LAEARDDSAAVLYLVSGPAERRKFALQSLDQLAIAAPLVKRAFAVEHVADLESMITKAYGFALEGEPGPVMIQVPKPVWTEMTALESAESIVISSATPSPNTQQLKTLLELLPAVQRPIIYAGQGCNDAAAALVRLAERLAAPVVMTRSARGIVPMDHPLALAFDFNSNGAQAFNELLAASDLILVLGCKLGHNGSAGFSLDLSREKLVHIDSCAQVLGTNYPCKVQIQADVSDVLKQVVEQMAEVPQRACWADSLIARFRKRGRAEIGKDAIEPLIAGTTPNTLAAFYHALRNTLPANACLVTDTGNHQVFTTRYFKSLVPRGLIIPTDFQSMGFGLPAAIGAKFAVGDRRVVAIVGDGSIAMCGMELLTIAREKLRMTVIVFNDRALGQIRQQQLAQFGHAHATNLNCLSLQSLAEAVGAEYFCLSGDAQGILHRAFRTDGLTLIEVLIEDSMDMKMSAAKGLARGQLRSKLNAPAFSWVKKLLKK
jgi:acetolactate synthase-1/2/3 large subunit